MTIEKSGIEEIAFQSAAEGFLVVDDQGIIVKVNQRLAELFGYEMSEMVGQAIELLIPKDRKAKHVGQRSNFQKNPHKRSMGQGLNLHGLRKDGSLFDVEVSLTPFINDEQTYVLGIVNDISNRIKQQNELLKTKENLDKLAAELEERVEQRTEELLESQRLYQLIARNFPDGVISIFDKNLHYVFVEGKELFKSGVTSEYLVGTDYRERLSPELADVVIPLLNEVFSGIDQSFEIDKHGEHYVLNAVGLKDKTGQVEHILLVEHNITKQRKAALDLAEALKKERQLNDMKSKFVSLASHEFRTPLSSVLSSATLIEKYPEADQQDKRMKHVDRIRSSVHNLTAILNDFLSLDKLEHDLVKANLIEFSLAELSQDVIEEVALTAKEGKTISHAHNGPQSLIKSDPGLLKNILLNLLNNAIKYSKAQGKVELITAQNDEQIELKVIDSGIGIPEADQESLFTRFFRASNSGGIQGTGLGLHIVKNYVDLLGGTIDWKSTEGEGTTFHITIPNKIK